MTDKSTLVIRIDGWLGRVAAMSWAITEVAKQKRVKVVTSRPLVFWWNPYIVSVHWLDDRNLFEDVIRWNDYIEIEPYTDPRFFNDAVNRLEIVRDELWLEEIVQPQMFLAEHEKFNSLEWPMPILYQPFGSTMELSWADRSYRSIKVQDAQYIADALAEKWFTLYEVIKPWAQPVLNNCKILDTPDLRYVATLCAKYPVIWADSSLQHIAKAFGKRAIIVRAWTDAERFGYESHINMREHPMVAHTPMRLPMNSFNLDVSNQHTNEFSKEFLDSFIENVINFIYNDYINRDVTQISGEGQLPTATEQVHSEEWRRRKKRKNS